MLLERLLSPAGDVIKEAVAKPEANINSTYESCANTLTRLSKDNELLPKIGAPATRALNALGINSLHQLVGYTEEQLLALHGFGPKAMTILKAEMKKGGVSFSENTMPTKSKEVRRSKATE